ncbi:hypothetical protein C8R43DRAFT_1076605 [Mycena crocata]|nr:hypothetical protein C8R43DRAFT_1076605 [Mycena crocata]
MRKAQMLVGGGEITYIRFIGASSDVPIHFYPLSTDLNPDWTTTHVSQDEQYRYWRKLTSEYGIYPRIVFNRTVVSAEWRIEENLYHDVNSGAKFTTNTQIVISALGILDVPRFSAIAGLSSFKGEMFHSRRCDKGVDMRGKRVAIVGNGASA